MLSILALLIAFFIREKNIMKLTIHRKYKVVET